MRLTIIIIFSLSFGKVFSQNSFFVIPSINTKVNICSTDWTHFSTHFPKNDYFDIYNNTLHLSPFIGLGLAFDWKNEKKNFKLGVSWNQDVAGVSAKEVYLSTNGTPFYYFNQELITKQSYFTNRFSINFTKPLIQDNLFLKLGAGLIFSSSGHKKHSQDLFYTTYSFDPFLLDTNITVGRTYSALANYRFSLNLSLGLTLDIKWSKVYLFSLDAIYTQGFKNITAAGFDYDITNLDSGVTTKLEYGLYSKGSGFTIQLSRKIQLYPWRPNRKIK